MKILALLLSLFALNAHGEHSVFFGLFTHHHNDSGFMDYRDESLDVFSEPTPYTQGWGSNKLIGYRFASDDWSIGGCTFTNSFNERTYCAFASIEIGLSDYWYLESGINLTYGYRPALVTQNPDDSINKQLLPASFGGIKFKYQNYGVTWQLVSSSVSTVVLEVGF